MSAAPKTVPVAYIEITPGVCGGRARIAGTRMKVSQVASEYEHLGLTPDEIVDAHPHLTLAGVRAALAHYKDPEGEYATGITVDWPRRWRESRGTDLRSVVQALDREPEFTAYYAQVARFIDFSEANHDWFKRQEHLGYG